MAIDPKSIEAFKKIVLLADKIIKAQKKINPRFDVEISNNLPAAIKDQDGPKIELYLTTLKATLKDIETSLDDARSALIQLGDLERADEEFVSAHLADMDKVTSKISEGQKKLTKQFEDGKKLQTQAEKALDAQHNTQEKAYQELAELDKWINDETKELKEAFNKSDKIATQAQAAVDSRDGKTLADAKKSMEALNIDVLEAGYGIHEPEITDFIKDLDASGFPADAIAELKKGAQETLSKHRANKTYVDELKAQQKLVHDFEIVAIDVKKAVKVLSLDPKAEPKLAKILNGPKPAMEKGLDALAKELKLKTTGKQMLAALQKAGML